MSQCECGLKSLVDARLTKDLTKNLLFRQREDGSMTRGLSARSSSSSCIITVDLNRSWKTLIEMYSHRTFTYERDRLSHLLESRQSLAVHHQTPGLEFGAKMLVTNFCGVAGIGMKLLVVASGASCYQIPPYKSDSPQQWHVHPTQAI